MTLAALFLALIATPADVSARPNAPTTAARGEPVLLNFETEWCGFCKKMRPAIAQLEKAGFPVESVDGDRQKDLTRRYKVTAFPTFIVVDDAGQVLGRTEGYQPVESLATLYRDAQAKVRSRAKGRPVAAAVSDRRDEDEKPAEDEPEDARPRRKTFKNPMPWQTVVRIRMKLSNHAEGVGSGTVVYSDARQALILTCAHIFKEDGRQTPKPAQYRTPIEVDLFDGQLGGPQKNQVHHTETLRGEAIDYDLTNDVGLIRIRPGRVLPASRVVPPYWEPQATMRMITVGCSEGREATAWDTIIIRPKAGLKHGGTGDVFHMIECETAPKRGRSGGGLYTEDGFLAGVCDFADPQSNRGLYAVPKSIYHLLDRNDLVALYDPAVRKPDSSQGLLAKAPAKPKRPNPQGTLRAQNPEDPEMPPPSAFGIKPPVLTVNEEDVPRGSASSNPWHVPASSPSKVASQRRPAAEEPAKGTEAIAAGMKREGSEELSPLPPAAPAEETTDPDDLPASAKSGGPTKWKPVRRAN
jgi:thiol-disulfide isomerase/thioredoxin